MNARSVLRGHLTQTREKLLSGGVAPRVRQTAGGLAAQTRGSGPVGAVRVGGYLSWRCLALKSHAGVTG